jgi:hypothetical protein
MPGAGGNEDGITWRDFAGFAIYFHGAVAFEDEVELFAELVVVAFGRSADRDGGFGEALVLHWSVGAVEDAADGAAVFGGEGGLRGKSLDRHIIRSLQKVELMPSVLRLSLSKCLAASDFLIKGIVKMTPTP